MRWMSALLLIAFMLILTTPSAEAQERPQPIIHAQREVEILDGGLLTVNDTFILEAPHGSQVQITNLKVGLPEAFTSERRSFYISSNGEWQPLLWQEAALGEPGFHGFDLELPSPAALEGGRTLEIMASYLFVDRISGDSRGNTAQIPVYPALTHNMSSFVIHVALPEGAILGGVDSPLSFTNSSEGGVWTLRHEAENLPPLRNENMTISYTPSPQEEYLLDCELIQRGIYVKPRRLRLEDTFIIANRGAAFSRFRLELPGGSSNIKARDWIGPLKVEYDMIEEDGGYVDIQVSPRSSVAEGERWRFTVEYSVPSGDHIEGGGGIFTLTIPTHDFKHYIRRFALVATLPEGGSFIASEPEHSSVRKVSAFIQEVTIELRGVMPSRLLEVVVKYDRPPLWSSFRPLVWALIAVGAAASVYILRGRVRVVEEVEPVEAVSSVLEDFLNLYRERVALLAEQEKIERGLDRREISREQFDRRSAEITRRQRDLLRTLRQLKGRLEAAYPVMRDGLLAIEEAETALERANTDQRNLEVRLRARRVSRRDYRRRRRDIIRRRGRALRRIEQLIAGIQARA